MKYIPLPKFDLLDAALNFSRDGLEIEGSCDIFTIKPTKSDKILKRRIDAQVLSSHQATLSMAASLSPPDAKEFAKSKSLSERSVFGDLVTSGNRRTYAYLIGILNACHEEYDLSNVLRPQDFCRERDVQDAINEIDAKVLGQDRYYASRQSSVPMPMMSGAVGATKWGYDKWLMIDEEMDLRECECYNFCPVENPFEGDGVPLWSLHYFFFNRRKKRVCYVQVRAVDPAYRDDDTEDDDEWVEGGVYDMDDEDEDEDVETEVEGKKSSTEAGARKRAGYWLGERYRSSTPQLDLDGIRAVMQYRKRHPEEFANEAVLDEEAGETTDDRGTSASPTPASSGEDSDVPIATAVVKGGLKVPKGKGRRGSSLRAMSASSEM